MKRLVRGLGSGRQGARQGYALALGKLLSDVPDHTLPVDQVLKVMSSELDVSGQAKVCTPLAQIIGECWRHSGCMLSCNTTTAYCCNVDGGAHKTHGQACT